MLAVEEPTYTLVDESNYDACLAALSEATELAVDTETTGLDPYGLGDRLVGVAVFDGRRSWYLPFRHPCALDGRRVDCNLPLNRLPRLLALIHERPALYWNMKFDVKMLYLDGMHWPLPEKSWDVLLLAHLSNENGKPFRLKEWARKRLPDDPVRDETELNALLKQRGYTDKGQISQLLASEVAAYACSDVRLTWRLRDWMVEKVYPLWPNVERLWPEINRYCLIVAEGEHRGILIDVDVTRDLLHNAEMYANSLLASMRATCRLPHFNPGSPKQITAITGTIASDRKTLLARLRELRQHTGTDATHAYLNGVENGAMDAAQQVKFITDLLDWKRWSVAAERYYRPYLELRDANDVIHCDYLIHGTKTGRLSCTNPNLQAIARNDSDTADDEHRVFRVKDCIKAQPGHWLLEADYSQAELRMVAFYAQETLMIEALDNDDRDLHQETADLLKIDRSLAKRLNFGNIYGLGVPGAAEKFDLELSVASELLQGHRRVLSRIPRYRAQGEQVARRDGEFKLYTGRYRRFYDQKDEDYRKALSNLIQGNVAEMVRMAMLNLHPLLPQGATILLQVHDSLLIEFPDSMPKSAAVNLVRDVMTDTQALRLPAGMRPKPRVEIEHGRVWGDLDAMDADKDEGNKHDLRYAGVKSA